MALTQVNSNGISDNSIVNADINSAANIASTKLAKPIDLADNEKVQFGGGQDFQIHHDGTNSLLRNLTGDLYIRNLANDKDIILESDNGSGGTTSYVTCDGSSGKVLLYHYGTEKLQTKSDGIDVAGEVQCDSLDVDGNVDVAGTIRTNRLVVDDDGSGSPLTAIRADDENPWAFNVGNDTYSTSEGIGYQMYQQNSGSIITQARGNSAYINWYLTTSDGSTSSTMIHVDTNRAVHLSHAGNTKLSTVSGGVNVQGELECDSLDVDGAGDFTGDVTFRGGTGAVLIAGNSDIRFETGSWTGESTKIQHHGTVLYIQGSSNGIQFRHVNGTDRCHIDGNGHFLPNANNSYDLGSSSLRWRNLYTNDLNLSNEGSANDVDGTWGNFTIQEGEDDLFLINRRSGKKYKFNLTEVN